MLRDFVNKEFRRPFSFVVMMAVIVSVLTSFLLMMLYVEQYENVIVRKISESISENQFAVDIAEVESAVIGEQRSIIGLPTVNVAESKTTERFLYQLLRQEFFVKEIKEREYEESFEPPIRGWRVPVVQKFLEGGRVLGSEEVYYETGIIFRMDGNPQKFPICLVYTFWDGEVNPLHYIGAHDSWLSFEQTKKAIIAVLKKEKKMKKIDIDKEKRIAKLQEEIKRLDRYHYDSIEDFRGGDDVDMKALGVSIRKTDKLRKELIELGGDVPKNPN